MNNLEKNFWLKMYMSDIIFNQHFNSKISLNALLIGIQFLTIIITLILRIFFENISLILNIIQLIIVHLCLILVVVNDYILNKTWKTAKERLNEIFESEENNYE